jgi:hypothetical protein
MAAWISLPFQFNGNQEGFDAKRLLLFQIRVTDLGRFLPLKIGF